jgi:membrane associated rhomboid family serine protease
MLWALTILAAFRAQLEWPGLAAAGWLEPQAIFQHGEWWRAGTALFLHANAEHVLANVMSGLLALTALLATFGTLRGWLLVAVSSLAANLAVAGIRMSSPYQSLGASTAIFAALGLLTGRAVRHASALRHSQRWRSILSPLGAGLVMLALYGAGGLNVDVGAHLMGFISGLLAGYLVGARPQPTSTP